MIEFNLNIEESILYIYPKSSFEVADFEGIAQKVDPYIEEKGGLRGLVIETESFLGWDSFGAFVAHIRFVRNHHQYIQKVALITDSSMGNVAEHLASHFVSAQIKHFTTTQVNEAKQWVMS